MNNTIHMDAEYAVRILKRQIDLMRHRQLIINKQHKEGLITTDDKYQAETVMRHERAAYEYAINVIERQRQEDMNADKKTK